MDRAQKRILLALLIIGPAVAIALVFLLAPKAETPRSDPLPSGNLTLVASGSVQDGGSGRSAAGELLLFSNGTGHWLRFEGYQAESGPNVWFHLVTEPAADSEAAVEEQGVRLRVPGPGQATYRGDFNVPLPPGTDLEAYRAVLAWDLTLDQAFSRAAWAPLPPAEADAP